MFNAQARWDRHMPQQEIDSLNEPILVSAFFNRSKILPRFFIWHKRLYRIKRVTYFWQERKGQELIQRFCVDTGNDIYQISFSNKTFNWQLDKIA